LLDRTPVPGRENRSAEYTLRELKKATEIIVWSETLRLMVENELREMRRVMCRYLIKEILESEAPADDYVEKCMETLRDLEEGMNLTEVIAAVTGKRINERFDDRNFFAHAGLEYNAVRVRVAVSLAYREEYVGKVKNALKKALKLRGSTQ